MTKKDLKQRFMILLAVVGTLFFVFGVLPILLFIVALAMGGGEWG